MVPAPVRMAVFGLFFFSQTGVSPSLVPKPWPAAKSNRKRDLLWDALAVSET